MEIPEPAQEIEAKKKPGEKDPYSALSFRHFILGAIAIFLYVGVEVGIPNFVNLFLSTPVNPTDSAAVPGLGYEAALAGSICGTYWFLMLIGRLVGGFLGGRFSSKAMLTFVSSLGLIFVLLAICLPTSIKVDMPVFQSDISFGLAEVPIGIMFLILCGLCTSVMWGGIFNLAVEGLGKYTAMASGIFMMLVCGGGILPLIQGGVADLFGYMASYWVVFAALIYMLFYAVIGCKNVNKDIPVD